MNTAILGMFRYLLNMILAGVDHTFRCFGRRLVHTVTLIAIIASIFVIVLLIYTGNLI